MQRTFAAATDTGKRRATNEDQAVAIELRGGRVLLAVADGAGGMGGGDVASATTVRAVVEVCERAADGEPGQALREAVETASAHVREAAREGQHSAMATTLVAAIVDEKRAWIVSIGDSRAYLHHAGVLRQLTEDDSWVADQVRANLLTEEQARRSPHRNIITRAIGASDVPAVEPLEVLLAAGDTLLLCSDGLHAVIDDKDIATLLAADSAEETAAALIDAANVAGGPDNIAVALYRAPMANRR